MIIFFKYTYFLLCLFLPKLYVFLKYTYFLGCVFFYYTYFYHNYAYFLGIHIFSRVRIFLIIHIFPEIICIFENAYFFSSVCILYIFRQNYAYLCVFLCILFQLCPVFIRIFLFWKLVTLKVCLSSQVAEGLILQTAI